MHQPRIGPRGFACQHARGDRIDGSRQIGLTLGLVHGRICCRVYDYVRSQTPYPRFQACWIGKVAAKGRCVVPVERHQLGERRERALQLPTDLAVPSEQQYLQSIVLEP